MTRWSLQSQPTSSNSIILVSLQHSDLTEHGCLADLPGLTTVQRKEQWYLRSLKEGGSGKALADCFVLVLLLPCLPFPSDPMSLPFVNLTESSRLKRALKTLIDDATIDVTTIFASETTSSSDAFGDGSDNGKR